MNSKEKFVLGATVAAVAVLWKASATLIKIVVFNDAALNQHAEIINNHTDAFAELYTERQFADLANRFDEE